MCRRWGLNRIKKDADDRWEGFIVKILNIIPFIVLVMSADDDFFL